MSNFPGYAQIRRVQVTATPWEVENGLLTATLKLRRPQLFSYYATEIAALYTGH
jgi:long-chain acyl-CoA synthetase